MEKKVKKKSKNIDEDAIVLHYRELKEIDIDEILKVILRHSLNISKEKREKIESVIDWKQNAGKAQTR